MDVEDPSSAVNDSFYDDFSSLIPSTLPGDYSFDDIDEILRSTNPDFNTFDDLGPLDRASDPTNFEIKNELTQSSFGEDRNDLSEFLSFDCKDEKTLFPEIQNAAFLSSNKTKRTSSTSSGESDLEQFNPDEFMKLLNNDNIKLEEFINGPQNENGMSALPQRHTPSPTGSCVSSSGSSTSGIQSDASSVGSMTPAYSIQTDVKDGGILNYNITLDTPFDQYQDDSIITEDVEMLSSDDTISGSERHQDTTTLPNSIPLAMLPNNVIVNPASTIIKPAVTQIISGGTIIPIKTVPINKITAVPINKPTAVLSAPLKTECKSIPKLNIVCNSKSSASIVKSATKLNSDTASGSAIPPANGKPKTIYLSSNDFKSLMQKVNSNAPKCPKLVGGSQNFSNSMPKIIMKTANGKVITTNRIIQPINGTNFIPKIIKTNTTPSTPITVAKQETQTNGMVVNNSKPNLPIAPNKVPDLNMYRGVIDERMLKKQQRMIRNRESASLSRKKKKEYVVSLEKRINHLEKENYTLKGENKSLRSQLMAFARTCKCKNGNISEFILKSLDDDGNGTIDMKAQQMPPTQPIKIAPKPAGMNTTTFKQRVTAASVRKNIAVLFAMAFMVTLNVGNFHSYLNNNRNSLESISEQQASAQETLNTAAGAVVSGTSARRLLWVETEAEYNEKLSRGKRLAEMEVPPLHFLRPVNNRTKASTMHEPPPGGSNGANQTEYHRLASSLRKWIGGNDHLNLSMFEKSDDDLENPTGGFKPTSDYFDMKTMRDLPLQRPAPTIGSGVLKRKIYVDYEEKRLKQRKTDNDLNNNLNDNDDARNSIEIFKPKINDEYLKLFKGIKRQDDTFYVLSFNMDHILLPASNYNKTARPKMSLMLPAGDPSDNGDIVLMQIDCEVMNTTELELKSHMIPEKLRHTIKLHPTTTGTSEEEQNHGKPEKQYAEHNTINSTVVTDADLKEKHKDWQLSKLSGSANQTLIKKLVETEKKRLSTGREPTTLPTIKQKPVVRTFFMMGPKSQAAADAMKKKPTIIKLSGNETAVNNVLNANLRNSTLYAKMRETVNLEFHNAP